MPKPYKDIQERLKTFFNRNCPNTRDLEETEVKVSIPISGNNSCGNVEDDVSEDTNDMKNPTLSQLETEMFNRMIDHDNLYDVSNTFMDPIFELNDTIEVEQLYCFRERSDLRKVMEGIQSAKTLSTPWQKSMLPSEDKTVEETYGQSDFNRSDEDIMIPSESLDFSLKAIGAPITILDDKRNIEEDITQASELSRDEEMISPLSTQDMLIPSASEPEMDKLSEDAASEPFEAMLTKDIKLMPKSELSVPHRSHIGSVRLETSEPLLDMSYSSHKVPVGDRTCVQTANDINIMNEYMYDDSQIIVPKSKPRIYDIHGQDYLKYMREINNSVESDICYKVSERGSDPTDWSILSDNLYYCEKEMEDKMYFSNDVCDEDNTTRRYLDNIRSRKAQYHLQQHDLQKDPESIKPRDLRYDQMHNTISYKCDMDKDITATYLWQIPQTLGEIRKTTDSWFPQGLIPMTNTGETVGQLLDGSDIKIGHMSQVTSLDTLIDSGASKAMLNKKFYDTHPFMHQYPVYDIAPKNLKIADGRFITVDKCIQFLINFYGFVFEIVAYLTYMADDFDFVIGQKTMFELEGGPNFGEMAFHFFMRSVNLVADEDVTILPRGTTTHYISLQNCPEDFNSANGAIIKLKHYTPGQVPYTLKVNIQNRKIKINAKNLSHDSKWHIKKGEIVGCLDMRSLGYFHISRNVLERSIGTQCEFLSEEETATYFSMLIHEHSGVAEVPKNLEHFYKMTRLKVDKNNENIDSLSNNYPEKDKDDPYPWLDEDDPRRSMTDIEIIKKYINLEETDLTPEQKEEFYQVVLQHREAFSLRDEIGTCPHFEVELELNDETPFFIRPFPIKETEKPIVDKEMRKGVLLGILRKGMTSYSSPIMLIPRKLSGIPRIVTDFRYLNSRLKVLNPSIPLVRDAIQMIGASGCEILSVIDLRDAYHTLRLSPRSQDFCGITPYYGSATYIYNRLGMGLSVSPAIWQSFITQVLDEIPNRQHYLAIMDDCLIHSKRKDHLEYLTNFFKAIINNGLKISPKKCQLFRTKLIYMGHEMLIKDGIPCITPMKNRLEAIEKLGPLQSVKNCKQFCGMVNYLSMYLKDLQKTLIPIYNLTKKGATWKWGKEEQDAYDAVKKAMVNPPVLIMPNTTGHFLLVSDTSKIATGCALYQEQKGRYRLVAYYSKKLPDACSRYSISELELTGLATNIAAFKHLLKNVNFSVYVDHSALVYILKSKKEAPTLRLKKLIEVLSAYSFDLNFLKGKDMQIADFLSRHPDNDTGSPHEIIPISFFSKETREKHFDRFCSMQEFISEVCYPITRHQAKKQQSLVPDIYPLQGIHQKPEHVLPDLSTISLPKEGEKGETIGHKNKNFDNSQNSSKLLKPLQEIEQIIQNNVQVELEEPEKEDLLNIDQSLDQQMFQPENLSTFLPKEITDKVKDQLPKLVVDQSFDFVPTEEDLNRKKNKLFDLINNDQIFRKHIPKQKELDKFINELKQKIIHQYHMPMTRKELKAEYKNSPFYRDIIQYIMYDKCSYTGKAGNLFKTQCEDYISIDGILFKHHYNTTLDKENWVLCIPEKYIPTVLHEYHNTILAGHPGITNLYHKVREEYFFPNMYEICKQYVASCFDCQSRKNKQKGLNIHYPRIPLDYKPMSTISMDVKHMPQSTLGFHHILLCTCERTNYVVGIPIANQEAKTIAEALFFRLICVYGTPEVIIMDEGKSLNAELLKAYFKALNISTFTVSPMNHGSNRTERYIQTLNEVICKNLIDTGDQWPQYVQPACFAMNTQISAVTGYSPHEMLYMQKPLDLLQLNYDPDTKGITVSTKQYMEYKQAKFDFMKRIILSKRAKEVQTQFIKALRKFPNRDEYAVGDLIYLYYEQGSNLHAPSKKLKKGWIGPLRIAGVLDDTHYLINDWQGLLLPIKVHKNRIKHFELSLNKMTPRGLLHVINTSAELLQEMSNAENPKSNDVSADDE